MYKTYEARYKKGKIELTEIPKDIEEADVLITFIRKEKKVKTRNKKSLKGCLKKYANPALIETEKKVWDLYVEQKHSGKKQK